MLADTLSPNSNEQRLAEIRNKKKKTPEELKIIANATRQERHKLASELETALVPYAAARKLREADGEEFANNQTEMSTRQDIDLLRDPVLAKSVVGDSGENLGDVIEDSDQTILIAKGQLDYVRDATKRLTAAHEAYLRGDSESEAKSGVVMSVATSRERGDSVDAVLAGYELNWRGEKKNASAFLDDFLELKAQYARIVSDPSIDSMGAIQRFLRKNDLNKIGKIIEESTTVLRGQIDWQPEAFDTQWRGDWAKKYKEAKDFIDRLKS